jgi:transposase-like protein
MCAYQEGATIAAAAQRHHVNADTLRRHITKHGFHKPGHIRSSARTTIPDAILKLHPKLSPGEIADRFGYTTSSIRWRLQLNGSYTPLPKHHSGRKSWASSLRNRENVLRAVDLRAQGLSYGEIGVRLRKPRSTVQTWIIKYHDQQYLWQNAEVPKWWTDAA